MINLYPYFYHDKPVSMFYHGKPVSMFYHDIPVSIFLSKQKNEWGSKRINLAVFHFLEMKIYSIYVYIYIYLCQRYFFKLSSYSQGMSYTRRIRTNYMGNAVCLHYTLTCIDRCIVKKKYLTYLFREGQVALNPGLN